MILVDYHHVGITGLLTFALSAFVANLAVALIMVTVLMAVAPKNKSSLLQRV